MNCCMRCPRAFRRRPGGVGGAGACIFCRRLSRMTEPWIGRREMLRPNHARAHARAQFTRTRAGALPRSGAVEE